MIAVVVAVVVVAVVLAVVLVPAVVAVVKSATLQKHICEVDEERSGNVDVVVESIRGLIDCNLKHAYKKTYRGWLGFTNWGGRPFICGGDTAQGGLAFLSSQKQHFLIKF